MVRGGPTKEFLLGDPCGESCFLGNSLGVQIQSCMMKNLWLETVLVALNKLSQLIIQIVFNNTRLDLWSSCGLGEGLVFRLLISYPV